MNLNTISLPTKARPTNTPTTCIHVVCFLLVVAFILSNTFHDSYLRESSAKTKPRKKNCFLFKKHNVWEFGVWTPHLNSKKQSKMSA
jgi:hypothetical protein